MKQSVLILVLALGMFSCSQSTIDPILQQRCQAICDSCVAVGLQTGMQFCVYRDGNCIVDVCSGHLSREEGASEVAPSSLFAIFSTEKPFLSTAVHRAVAQGLMDYDKPLNTWWPEFTGGGKDSLTLRMTLAYRSGMPVVFDKDIFQNVEQKTDWNKVVRWAAAADTIEKPCGKQRYMSLSYGWMLGHPLEVAYGKPLKVALDELVLQPAGISDEFYFAVPDSELSRVATTYGQSIESMNNDTLRRACMPSAWGVASARSIARFYNRLCGYDGEEPLISSKMLDEALVLCRADDDPLPTDMESRHHMVFGMGYGLWGHVDDLSSVFGHGGAGGSGAGLVNRETRTTIGITCNDASGSNQARYLLLKAVGFDWRNADNPEAPL